MIFYTFGVVKITKIVKPFSDQITFFTCRYVVVERYITTLYLNESSTIWSESSLQRWLLREIIFYLQCARWKATYTRSVRCPLELSSAASRDSRVPAATSPVLPACRRSSSAVTTTELSFECRRSARSKYRRRALLQLAACRTLITTNVSSGRLVATGGSAFVPRAGVGTGRRVDLAARLNRQDPPSSARSRRRRNWPKRGLACLRFPVSTRAFAIEGPLSCVPRNNSFVERVGDARSSFSRILCAKSFFFVMVLDARTSPTWSGFEKIYVMV